MKIPLLIGAGVLAGCVTEGPQRPQRKAQPSDVLPAKLVPTASVEFTDTDANRYRDSTTVVVYVMGDVPNYHLPLKVKGEFALSLQDPQGKVIAAWTFDRAQTAAALSGLQPGPGFVFGLDLRRSSLGTDVVQTPEADLVVVFTPEKGDPIRARTSAPILIGPVGARGRW
jgi:hypothetical protein